MREHRRLAVVHAVIGEVIQYFGELRKFFSSTKHAFVTWREGDEALGQMFTTDRPLLRNTSDT